MGGIYKDRQAVVVFWDTGDYEGPVKISTANATDPSDVSSTNLDSNQGYAALTYPLDYAGGSHVKVTGGDTTLDEFDISV